jgi:TolB-like protein
MILLPPRAAAAKLLQTSAMLRLLAVLLLLAAPAFAGVDAGHPTRVAVLYFDVQSSDPELSFFSKGLAAMMITDLASSPLQVVERDRLEALLAELKLGEGRFADKSKFAKIGALLGADYLVTGTLIKAAGVFSLELKLFSVTTSLVVHTFRAMLKEADVLDAEQRAVESVLKHLDKLVVATAPTAAPGTKPTLGLAAAVKYSRALDAKDKKDPAAARKLLSEVVKEQPDFKLAQLDLLSLRD